MTESDIRRLEALAEAARPGPWIVSIEGRDHTSGSTVIQVDEAAVPNTDIEPIGHTDADLDFIAAARTAVPALIAEIRRLRGPQS